MKKLKYTLLFFIINFTGLAIGNFFMNDGPKSDWYLNLNKAPWTPPGWVFGAAWTFIMICFSIYLGKQFSEKNRSKLISIVFCLAFILNVSWNYIFFNQQLIFLALINITLLTTVLCYCFFNFKNYNYLLLPYIIWLCMATSLNLYILVHN